MNLNPSEDQRAIVSAIRELMDRESLRNWGRPAGAATENSLPPALWRSCAELGWFGLAAEESLGGVGLGVPEEVLLFREIGRYLMPGPFLGTVIGAHVLTRAGDHDLAGQLVSGARRAGWNVGRHALDADPGDLMVEIDAGSLIVHELLEAEPVGSVDPTVGLSRIGNSTEVVRARDPLLVSRAQLLIAAALLGIAEAVRDQSAEYAKQRHQFGKPIGIHQAVKHRCADQVVRCWSTRAQLFLAALLLEAQRPEAALAAPAAVMLARDAAWQNTSANVHNHGGIGVTAEHTAGNYVKRTQILDQSLGSIDAVVSELLSPEPTSVAARA